MKAAMNRSRLLFPLLSALVAMMPSMREQRPGDVVERANRSRQRGMSDVGPLSGRSYRVRYRIGGGPKHLPVNITRECARRVRQRERNEANRAAKVARLPSPTPNALLVTVPPADVVGLDYVGHSKGVHGS